MTQYDVLIEYAKNAGHFKLQDVTRNIGISEVYCRQLLHKGIDNGVIRLHSKGVWTFIRTDEQSSKIEFPELSVSDRFEYLKELVGMVAKKIQPSMLLTGTSGVGKSWLVMQTLEQYGLKQNEDYFICKGHSSPLGLYQTLHDKRDSLILYDDCDSALRDDLCVNLLKAALDSYDKRIISWQSSRADSLDLERSFEFEGQVIFISNMQPQRIDEALKTRAFCYDLHLDPDEMHEYMKELLPNIMNKVPFEQRQEVLNYLHNFRNTWKNYNLRSLIQAIRIRAGVSANKDWKKMVQVLSEGAL